MKRKGCDILAILEIKEVTKSFGEKRVLNGLTFNVFENEIYGLLGPNGSGKTTTINIICNLLQPDSGAATINGISVSKVPKNQIGIVPQEISLYENLTCTENLWFFATIYGLSGEHRNKQIKKCLEAVNMTGNADTLVGKLSGGMKRRINVIIALLHRPDLLILDEPTVGLDVISRNQLWKLILNLKKQGKAILLTTHLLEEVENFCSRIGIIKNGRIVAEGKMEDLRKIIHAAKLAIIESNNRIAIYKRAEEYGLTYRLYGGDLMIWLQKPMEIREVVDLFDGIPVSSISLKPVSLEHIYLEVIQNEDY